MLLNCPGLNGPGHRLRRARFAALHRRHASESLRGPNLRLGGKTDTDSQLASGMNRRPASRTQCPAPGRNLKQLVRVESLGVQTGPGTAGPALAAASGRRSEAARLGSRLRVCVPETAPTPVSRPGDSIIPAACRVSSPQAGRSLAAPSESVRVP